MKSLPQPCSNSKYGCKEILMTEDTSNHELSCEFQKVYCAVLDCKKEGLVYWKYLKHVDEIHNLPVIQFQKKVDFSFLISDDFNTNQFLWRSKR